jgi:HD-GYP domain-containing protein (c-di-GMP phosphodiesterase class II)
VDSYSSPDAEALLRERGEQAGRDIRARREIAVHGIGAVSFLLSAALLAWLAPWHRSLSLPSLTFCVGLYVAGQQVKFPVTSGWTAPTMVAFVPMLFLLPTPIVPLVVMAAILLSRARDLWSRPGHVKWTAVFIGDAWFSFGPALVIVLAEAQSFRWQHWPIYLCALGAQILCDMGSTVGRCHLGEGISPQVQLPLLAWVYCVDAALAPLGLNIAAVSVNKPTLVLLALSPIGLLGFLAGERQQRLDSILALGTAYRGTALLLGDVVEADDAYTGTHSRDVVDLSLAVADALDLDPTQRQQVEFAALLHDVGKIRVPKEILNKHGDLSDEEAAILRRHTIDGEQMLKQVGGTLSSVGRIVRASHERYDGDGYPDGLTGDQIPVEARIIGVCDAYSAMTTDRPYRAALPHLDAVAELRRCAGSQFDPAIVDAVVAIVKASNSVALARTSPRPATDGAAEVVTTEPPHAVTPRWVTHPEVPAERALDVLAADLQRGG